jgi:shikimate kinase
MSQQPVIALVGLSGAGKSSVGRGLAARLGWPLLDTDALIVREAGRDIQAIFAAEGEAHFRDLETAALERALSQAPAVIATGGGIVLRPANRELLRRRAKVAWLDAPTEALVARLLAHEEVRPLVHGERPAERLEALRLARAPLYAEVAGIQIETDGHSVEQIVEQILSAFKLAEHTAP